MKTNCKKGKFVGFRATPSQWQRLTEISEDAGVSCSEVLRTLVDSATVVRPIIVSTYNSNVSGVRQALVTHVQ